MLFDETAIFMATHLQDIIYWQFTYCLILFSCHLTFGPYIPHKPVIQGGGAAGMYLYVFVCVCFMCVHYLPSREHLLHNSPSVGLNIEWSYYIQPFYFGKQLHWQRLTFSTQYIFFIFFIPSYAKNRIDGFFLTLPPLRRSVGV